MVKHVKLLKFVLGGLLEEGYFM